GVGVPEAVADDLVGDRVDLRLRLGRELQVGRHLDRAGRVEGVVDAVPELGRADRAAGLGGGGCDGGGIHRAASSAWAVGIVITKSPVCLRSQLVPGGTTIPVIARSITAGPSTTSPSGIASPL